MAETQTPEAQLLSELAYWRQRALTAEHAATHDGMTGLLNRRGLFASVESGAVVATFATVFDADGLKAVNDTEGHDRGDAFLCTLALRLEGLADTCGGLVARTGGDEFVLLSERIPDVPEDLPVSFGTEQVTGDLDDAIRMADLAMYARKRARYDGLARRQARGYLTEIPATPTLQETL